MRSTLGGAAVATVLAAAAPAAAQTILTPIIDGDYAATTLVYCQPTLTIDHSNGVVSTVTASQGGQTSYSSGLESYNSRTGKVKISGFLEQGSSLLLNDSQSGVSGTAFNESQQDQTLDYSNTISSVTIGGVTYHVTWGLRKKEVAQYFVLQTLDAKGCVTQSEKVRK
jgi:hypothetical protein